MKNATFFNPRPIPRLIQVGAILVVAAIIIIIVFNFINNWIYPVQTLNSEKNWIVRYDNEMISSFFVDTSDEIEKEILIAKNYLKIRVTSEIRPTWTSNQMHSNLAKNIITYSKIDCLSDCAQIYPGSKFKIIKSYRAKNFRFNRILSSDTSIYLLVDNKGDKYELHEYLFDQFKNVKETEYSAYVKHGSDVANVVEKIKDLINNPMKTNNRKEIDILFTGINFDDQAMDQVANYFLNNKIMNLNARTKFLDSFLKANNLNYEVKNRIIGSLSQKEILRLLDVSYFSKESLLVIVKSFFAETGLWENEATVFRHLINSDSFDNHLLHNLIENLPFNINLRTKVDLFNEIIRCKYFSSEEVNLLSRIVVNNFMDVKFKIPMLKSIINSTYANPEHISKILYSVLWNKSYMPEGLETVQDIIKSNKLNILDLDRIKDYVIANKMVIENANSLIATIDKAIENSK